MSETVNKYLYKTFLKILKHLPISMLALFMIGFWLNINGISTIFITFICGTSVVTLFLLYMLSYIFKYCSLFRLPLHYIVITNLITIIVKIVGITCLNLFLLRCYLFAESVILIFYIWSMYKNRNNPKVDYIKNLCDRYC